MTCVLYLVRHGIAADPVPGGGDAGRPLTPEGVRKMRRVASGLQCLGAVPELVLASPLRRAQETAAAVAHALPSKPEVETYDPLAPGHDADAVLKGLRPYRGAAALMLVGHEPSMGMLASRLLTGQEGGAALPFKKGAVAAIEVSALPPHARGVLLWFMTPKQLGAVGDSAAAKE